MNDQWKIGAPSRLVAATLMGLVLAPAAFAADNAEDSSTAAEIVVTGSRIARPGLESTTPITIVSAPEIAASGYLNAADVLRNLPQVGISGISSSNSNFSTSGGGINTINLRNLGDNRTLVLVNGRRMVSGYTAGALNVVDINMIPTDFVERVDVITGGASAVYGSEAIAGVVNFVLKDHFEGIRIRGQGGGATEGGENTRLGSVTAGSSFAEDRGSAMINIAYDKDTGLKSAQRAISKVDTSISFPAYAALTRASIRRATSRWPTRTEMLTTVCTRSTKAARWSRTAPASATTATPYAVSRFPPIAPWSPASSTTSSPTSRNSTPSSPMARPTPSPK